MKKKKNGLILLGGSLAFVILFLRYFSTNILNKLF